MEQYQDSKYFQALQKWNTMSVQEKLNIMEYVDNQSQKTDRECLSECIEILKQRM